MKKEILIKIFDQYGFVRGYEDPKNKIDPHKVLLLSILGGVITLIKMLAAREELNSKNVEYFLKKIIEPLENKFKIVNKKIKI